jgi:hypothetical protein
LPTVIKVWAIEEPLPPDAPLTPFSTTLQLNVVSSTSELRAMEVVSPLHRIWLEGVAITFGVGFTVTITVVRDPTQPSGDVGVIEYVAVP